MAIKMWAAPSTRACNKNAWPRKTDTKSFSLDAAKGEFASVQIILRNKVHPWNDENAGTRTVKLLGASIKQTSGAAFDLRSVRIGAQEYVSFADGNTYPDPISNSCKVDILANTAQSVWVTLFVPYDQAAGEYSFEISFDCEPVLEERAEIKLQVYNVTLPTPDKGEYSIQHFQTPESQDLLDDGGYACRAFDDKWWAFMEEFAKSLRECRSNVYRIYPLALAKAAGSHRLSRDKWNLDFSLLERMTDLLQKSGTAKAFAIDDTMTPLKGREVYMLNENGEIITVDISDPDAEIWITEYFTSLYEYIKKHSDPKKWIMHLQDEPASPEGWLWLRKLARKYMPDLRCGNPFALSIAKELGDDVDIYIPIFDIFERDIDFYNEVMKNPNKEVWSYCCCGPEDPWYLNRFIDEPAIYGRLIGWATYSRGLSGFLHWGYCFWNKADGFYPFSNGKFSTYKGDSQIIYPSPEDNSYRISIRYINIRDGAQDYELLKIAEKLDREEAQRIAKSVAAGYGDFNADEDNLKRARRELLLLAERAQA